MAAEGFWAQGLFHEPLLDLGEHEDRAFAGVLSPRSEVGAPRLGVNAVFLGDAEGYYEKYQGFSYWRGELKRAVAQFGIARPETVVEFGCGFGNATLPALDLFSDARLVASDISPNLLAILRRLLDARPELAARCAPVCMDALKPYLRDGVADLVFGAAILHHLTRPEDFVAQALRALRPGGSAIFFEPLEGGQALVILACEEIAREATRRGGLSPLEALRRIVPRRVRGFRGAGVIQRATARALGPGPVGGVAAVAALAAFADGAKPQILRDRASPAWAARDDKWAFARSHLAEIARACGAEMELYGLDAEPGLLRRQVEYVLAVYEGMSPADLPEWAWRIVHRLDHATFSPELMRDMAVSGCVLFRKPPA